MSTAPKIANFEEELFEETKRVFGVICYLAISLYPMFWLGDWIYYKAHVWPFLFLRLAVVVTCAISLWSLKRVKTASAVQKLALGFTTVCAFSITAMIGIIHDPSSSYYAGLNLVGIGTITFVPWQRRFLPLAVASVYAPFFVYGLYFCLTTGAWQQFLLSALFAASTAIITTAIRIHSNVVRKREHESRAALVKEVSKRNNIINKKTKELLSIRNLSKQFSPQIVDAIANGKLHLEESIHRAPICALFVDIVNSTGRIVRLDNRDLDKVINRFMDDTIHVLLKHDLTIDKFLGDGILAFSNDPIRQIDYIERTVIAAEEILAKVNEGREFYEEHWLAEFQVRIGVASGYANVGFYGSKEAFRTYTAIGPVMNLASRLCSTAEPNAIVVSNPVFRALEANRRFSFESLGTLKLKGFEDDIIKAHRLTNATAAIVAEDSSAPNCAECNSKMELHTDVRGIYQFRCGKCDVNIVPLRAA